MISIARPRIRLFHRHFIKRTALVALLAGWLVSLVFGQADGVGLNTVSVSDMATYYFTQVDRWLNVPNSVARRYGQLAEEALAAADITLDEPGHVVVVDRDPQVQALLVFSATVMAMPSGN